MQRRWRWSLLVSIVAIQGVLPAPAKSQEARFLSLAGEGSATLLLDDATSTAYLTDGGSLGVDGIRGALVDDRPVLEFVTARAERLIITCSHPHRDHHGGLAELLRLKAICEFPEIVLIDTPDSYGAGEALRDIWQNTCGELCTDPPTGRCRYVSARSQDAFAGLALEGAAVRPANFVFDPAEVGNDAHDRTIITHYKLGQDGVSKTLVDFDDASSRLIRYWAERNQGRRVDVVVMSHHGSRYNDMAPVLGTVDFDSGRIERGSFGVEQVVFAVNRYNRFYHPAPEILRQAVELLGHDNVFVTDSVPGRSIRVTPDGISYDDGTSPTRSLAQFVDARQTQLREARAIIEAKLLETAGLPENLRAPLTAGSMLSPDQLAVAVASGWLTQAQRRTLREALLGELHLDAVRERLGPTSPAEHLVALTRAGGHQVAPQGFPGGGEGLVAASALVLGETTWTGQPPEVWRVALRSGDLAALAILPAGSHTASDCPDADTACTLATSWPANSADAATWLLFDPDDAAAIGALSASLASQGLRMFVAGAGTAGPSATPVTDLVLVSSLIAESPDFWVWSTSAIASKTSKDCPWVCVAALLPKGTSAALDRYRKRTSG